MTLSCVLVDKKSHCGQHGRVSSKEKEWDWFQAVQDGVDILNLSLGPNSPPADTTTTFLSVFDLACLEAVRAGVLVVQAAGNGGPYPQTTLSFSPWITTVAAGVDDRTYPNYIDLGNNQKLMGEGLAREFLSRRFFPPPVIQIFGTDIISVG